MVNINPPTGYGYAQTLGSNTLPSNGSNPWNHGTPYWLACVGSGYYGNVRGVSGSSACVDNYSCVYFYGFRPIVCLKSGLTLVPDPDVEGAYMIQ